MSGYSTDEIIGKTHQLLQGPNTDTAELARLYLALDAWKPFETTIVNYTKSGKQYWVNQTLNPVSNQKGEYTHWISIERDVTSRKKQEKELYITTLRLFDTLESIQDGFYTLDNNWNITYWNQEAEKISDTTSDYMIGKNFWEFFEGRISQKMNKAFHKAKSSNIPIRTEVYS
jgi:PAS domain S-box-containing protein